MSVLHNYTCVVPQIVNRSINSGWIGRSLATLPGSPVPLFTLFMYVSTPRFPLDARTIYLDRLVRMQLLSPPIGRGLSSGGPLEVILLVRRATFGMWMESREFNKYCTLGPV
jgi:hypothetical protein